MNKFKKVDRYCYSPEMIGEVFRPEKEEKDDEYDLPC